MSPHIWNLLLLTALLGDLAIVFSAIAAGTTVSMRRPFRARRRGLSGRGGNSWEGAAVSLGVFAAGAMLGVVIWGARRLAGAQWADAAGLTLAGMAMAAGAAIWWRSLDLNARVFVECRERLIEALAKTEED